MEPLWARWEALKIDWSKLELSSLAGLPPLMTFIRDPATEDMFEEVCLTLFEIFVQRDFYLPLHFFQALLLFVPKAACGERWKLRVQRQRLQQLYDGDWCQLYEDFLEAKAYHLSDRAQSKTDTLKKVERLIKLDRLGDATALLREKEAIAPDSAETLEALRFCSRRLQRN
jgi:hypothetical protein